MGAGALSQLLNIFLKKMYMSCIVWIFISFELFKFHCCLIVVKDLCMTLATAAQCCGATCTE